MATSLLMSSTDKEEINHQPSMRRSTARRKSKNSCCSSSSSKNEKQKQRGMGVEKLERLRMAQERWKQMTEMNTDASVVRDHRVTVAPNSDTVMMINASANNVLPMKFGHVGFNPQRFVGEGFGASSFLGRNVNLAPGLDVPEHCSLCNKKKRVVDGENLGAVRSDMFKKWSNNFGDAGNFLGLRCGENDRTHHVINNQENINLGSLQTKPPFMPLVGSYAATNAKQGVEIVAVHKKGSREDGNNTVLMEYEFFPSLKKKVTGERSHQPNDDDDDLVMMRMMTANNMKSSSSSEASCACKCCDYQCSCCGIDAASGSIDLSLKL